MSGFKLFPGLSGVTNTVSTSGVFPTNVLNQNPVEGSQTFGLLSQTTGLLSHPTGLLSGGALDWATPKPPAVWDASFTQLIFAILLRFLSFLRGFIPPYALSLFLLCIPPLVSFYELTLRRFIPQLPSMFTIVFKLYKNGVLTIGAVTWILPQSMLGGLGAIGGVAMGGTAAFANGATAVVGSATATAGAVVGGVAGLATNGLNGAADFVGSATKGIAEGISHIQTGELEVAQNIAHLMSGQGAAASLAPAVAKDVMHATVENTNALAQGVIQATVGNTGAVAKDAVQAAVGTTHAITEAALQSVTNPVAAIGATQTAMTEGATKLAHAMDSVNPLSKIIPKDAQVTNPVAAIGATQVVVTEGATKLAHAMDSVNPLSNIIPKDAKVTNPVATIGATQAAVTESTTKLAHALDSVNPLSNLKPKDAQGQRGALGNMLRPKLPGST